jgi:hypothetical protein
MIQAIYRTKRHCLFFPGLRSAILANISTEDDLLDGNLHTS